MNVLTPLRSSILLILCLLLGISLNAQTWVAAGSAASSYEMGGDPTAPPMSGNEGFITSLVPNISGFGSYETQVDPDTLLGKAIKLTAFVRTVDVDDYAGLWLRIDSANVTLHFDNMFTRPIQSTTDWQEYTVTLDVPENATNIVMGLLLSGSGEAYVGGLSVEEIPRTWDIQYSSPQPGAYQDFVFSLAAVDSQMVWAGMGGGRYLHTQDAGDTWSLDTITGAENLFFNSMVAINADTIFLLGMDFINGGEGSIYGTVDGGTTWNLLYQNTNPAVFFNSMAFWDAQHGLAVSDPVGGKFLLVRTTDGGNTWQEVPAANLPTPLPTEWAGFGDGGGTCLTVAEGGYAWFGTAYGSGPGRQVRVIRSVDSGQTWTAHPLAFGNTRDFYGIGTISFRDSLHGFAGGTNFPPLPEGQSHTFFRTDDGGVSWTLVDSTLGISPNTIVQIPHSDDSLLMLSSIQGTWQSADSGMSWQRLSTEFVSPLTFSDARHGWTASSINPHILRFIPQVDTAMVDTMPTDTTPTDTGIVHIAPPMHGPAFQVFPNPVVESLTISSSHLLNGYFVLYDPQGRRLQAGIINHFPHQLPVQHLPSGAYWLDLHANGRRWQHKILKR